MVITKKKQLITLLVISSILLLITMPFNFFATWILRILIEGATFDGGAWIFSFALVFAILLNTFNILNIIFCSLNLRKKINLETRFSKVMIYCNIYAIWALWFWMFFYLPLGLSLLKKDNNKHSEIKNKKIDQFEVLNIKNI